MGTSTRRGKTPWRGKFLPVELADKKKRKTGQRRGPKEMSGAIQFIEKNKKDRELGSQASENALIDAAKEKGSRK